MPAGVLGEGQLILHFRRQQGWRGHKHGLLMNTRWTVPLSAWRDVVKGPSSLSPVALPGMGSANVAPGSFVLGVTSS